LHEENQALRTALAYTEQDLAYQEAKRLQALRTALAQPEQWKTCRHCGFDYRPPKANKWFPLAQTEQECIYPDCETGIGCDGPCGEKPVDTVKQEPAVYKCPRCATSMDVDLNAKPVDTVNTSQERETAKRGHEPVAFGFQNTAITESNRWMMLRETIPADDQYQGSLWTPLYTAPPKREWVGLTDEEAWKCWDWEDFQGTWKSMESKLKEKNT
jgi:hypothetical protein